MADDSLPPFPPDSDFYKQALALAKERDAKVELFGPLVSSLRDLYDICLVNGPLAPEENKQILEAGELVEQALNLLTPEEPKDS